MESHFVSITLVISLFCGIADAAEVTWRTGDRLPDAMTAAAIRDKAAAWQAQHGQGGPRERHVLVQFTQPLSAERQDLLAGKGVQLLQPLGGNAFFAKIDASRIDATDLQQNHHIAGLHEIRRDWKIHPKLVAGNPPWAVISRKADGQTPDVVVVYVILHRDVDRTDLQPDLVNRHNAVVRSEATSINCLVVELPADKLDALADEDSVQWIEPPLPPLEPNNDSSRARTQAEVVQAVPYGLDGSGVNVLVYDGASVDASHPDLTGRVFVRDSTALETGTQLVFWLP